MTVYGFVLAERLNLVMHDEILSVYITNRFVSPVFAGEKRIGNTMHCSTYGVHLVCLPFPL
jgi:hypothetical protein